MKQTLSIVTALAMALGTASAFAANTATTSVKVSISPAQHRANLEANAARAAAEAAKANAHLRRLDVAYGIARAGDTAMRIAVKEVPGGSAAYAGGRAVGNVIMHELPRIQRLSDSMVNKLHLPKIGHH